MKDIKISDIKVEELSEEDLMKMPQPVINALSKKRADAEYEEIRTRIDRHPRDWLTGIDDNDKHICGVLGETIYCTPHLIIHIDGDFVGIYGWQFGGGNLFEIFRTREKIDSFIEALVQAKDQVFG